MTRLNQFEDTINILNNIVKNELPGFIVAKQLIIGFEHAKKIEQSKDNDLNLLKKLCDFGLPYRDIGAFNKNVIDSVYSSFEEMKKLLNERLKNESDNALQS